jgi:hypothetical protein
LKVNSIALDSRKACRWLPLIACGLALILIQGCARNRVVDQSAYQTLSEAAHARAEAGEWRETYAITLLLEETRRDDKEMAALQDASLRMDPSVRALKHRRWLGGNHPLRTETTPTPVLTAILLYPVNVIADLADLVTLEVGYGIGLGAKAKVTELGALGLQASQGETMLGWAGGRPSLRSGSDSFVDILGLNFRAGSYPADRAFGNVLIPYATDGIKQPNEPPYQRSTDYYGIGGRVQAAIVGVNVEFHPVQLIDAVAGLLFIDPLNDGLVVTEPVRLNQQEREAASKLFR